MAKQVVKTLATNMVLDTTQAKAGLKELNQAVKDSTNEAKILENQYKSSGDQVAASKAKYEGLQHALEAQKTKIDTLKQALENNNTETKKGQEVQTLLQTQLANSERAYAGYQGQLEKATQAYKYQESGLSELNKEMKHGNDMTDARVRALQAEGKEEEANKVRLQGLKDTQENYTKQLEIQKKELNQLADSGDKSSDSYKRQELRVAQMSAKLSESTRDIAKFNDKQDDVGQKSKGFDEVHEKAGKLTFTAAIAGVTALTSGMVGFINKVADTNSQIGSLQAHTEQTYGQAKKSYKAINDLYIQGYGDSLDELQETYTRVQQLNPKDSLTELADKTKLATTYAKQSGADVAEVLAGASKATTNLGISYQDYFDLMTTASKKGLDTQGSLSDEMGEYSQVLGQMGFKAKDAFGMLQNGIDSGAYNSDKLLDFVKEFGISLNDGRMQDNIGSFSKGTQEMFTGYKKGTITSAEMMKAVTSDLGQMGDKQKEATLTSNLWSALGEDNALKVVESMGKTNTAFDQVGGTAKKTADQLKTSNPFELAKRGAESFTSTLTLNEGQVKKLKDAAEPLGKALKQLFESFMKNLPKMIDALTPVIDFVGKHLPEIITGLTILGGLWGTSKVIGYGKAIAGVGKDIGGLAKKGAGLIIKPKVDGSPAKRELGIISKAGKGIGKAFWWTGKLAIKSVLKSLELIGDGVIKTGKAIVWTAKLLTKALLDSLAFIGRTVTSATVGIAKGLKWTASIITKGATKALDLFKRGAVASGKGIGKALKFTASVATKGASLAMAGLVKTAKVTGTGIKLAFNFLKANPLILLITGIVAAVAALTALYKHNKKFRDFVNGLVKAAADFFKGIAKWFGQVVKTITETFNKVLKFMKKDWKEILLLIVNPFAGAFALLYKHNKKFRDNVNQLVKDVIKFFTNMGNAISDIFNNIKKTITNIFNSVKDFLFNTVKTMYNNWVASFNQMFNFFKGIWNGIKKFGSDSINSLKGTFDNVLGSIGKAFGNTWNGIKNGFSDMWNGMKDLAGKGINAVIKIPNAGISGINGLIHDFGGPKSALGQIPKVAFASGTGAFNNARRPINKPTLAVLNDGNDSPETGNKEALLHPNGQLEVVQGRNTERLLMPGTEVFNASELALLMGKQQFASGTGFLGSIWDGVKGAGSWVGKTAGNAWDGIKDATDKFTKMFGFITNAVAHPVKTLEGVFDPKSNSSLGNMMGGLATGTFKHVKTQATDWWKSLWSMASDEASGGGTSELLNKMVKAGTGKPYVWGATGPDSFDCSGLVQYALREMNKSFPHYSGDQWNASTPVSDPKAGDLAFFGPGGSDHVGVYSGNGKMFSAQSPQSSPNIGFANISDWSEPLAGYRRVPGLKSDDEKSSNSNPMASLIKGQVGGMFEWIKKFIAPTQDSPAEPAGDGVGRWRSDVTKALGKLGLSTSGSMISKVLKQIQTESGGNASAMGGNDGLADGNATGLMQVKPGTFRAYASAGHDNIMNGYDNILAGLAYAKNRYGSNLSSLGQGHGYANGGLITQHQIAEIGEGNKPEMIIPLDGMKSSRGFELLGKTAVAMASRDGQLTGGNTSDLSSLEGKFDQMLGFLSQLVSQGNNPTPAYVVATQAKSELDNLKARNNRTNILYGG